MNMNMNMNMNVIEAFNSKSGFQITIPSAKHLPMFLNNSTVVDDIQEMIRALDRYKATRDRGYSDDHLASEIGSFVLELNQKISSINSS
jgi:hypothetical protein